MVSLEEEEIWALAVTEGRLGKDTGRRQPFTSRGEKEASKETSPVTHLHLRLLASRITRK